MAGDDIEYGRTGMLFLRLSATVMGMLILCLVFGQPTFFIVCGIVMAIFWFIVWVGPRGAQTVGRAERKARESMGGKLTTRAWLGSLSVLAVCAWGVFVFNWWFPFVRFESHRLNYVFMIIVFSLPIVGLVIGRLESSVVIKRVAIPANVYACFVSVPLACGTILLVTFKSPEILTHDTDFSFERIGSLRVGSSEVVTYRTNTSALDPYGTVLREERELLPGLRRVRFLHRFSRSGSVVVERVGENKVRCTAPRRRHVLLTLKL